MSKNSNITLPIKKLEAQLKKAMPAVPKIMGNETLEFALDNFKKQGFQGSSFQKWKKRKDPTKWGPVERPGRAILTDSGRLKGAGHIKKISNKGVTLAWPVPYAKTHNEGITGIGQIQKVKPFVRSVKAQTQSVKAFSRRVNGETQSVKAFDRKIHAHSQMLDDFTRRINQKLPKRQFIGKSPYLSKRVIRQTAAYFKKHLKK